MSTEAIASFLDHLKATTTKPMWDVEKSILLQLKCPDPDLMSDVVRLTCWLCSLYLDNATDWTMWRYHSAVKHWLTFHKKKHPPIKVIIVPRLGKTVNAQKLISELEASVGEKALLSLVANGLGVKAAQGCVFHDGDPASVEVDGRIVPLLPWVAENVRKSPPPYASTPSVRKVRKALLRRSLVKQLLQANYGEGTIQYLTGAKSAMVSFYREMYENDRKKSNR